MTPETCPGCGTKLQPEMLACPNCPMSFPEDEPASGVHPLRQTKAYAFLMPALFFAAIGAAVWYLAIGLLNLGERNTALGPGPSGGSQAVQEQDPESKTDQAAREQPMGPATSPDSSSDEVPVAVPETERAASPGAGSVLIMSSEQVKKLEKVAEWRLRGRVYDLTTLKPVAGCALVFVDEPESRRVETRSSADGGYRVIVPSLPDRGYAVSIAKEGYSPAYLNPGTEGVPEMPSAQRRQLSKELSATLTFSPYSVQAYDAQPLVTDFYLAPRP